MIQNCSPAKKSPSFLDRFKGKHVVISKQGLFNLFQCQKKQIKGKKVGHHLNIQPQMLNSMELKLKQLQKLKNSEIFKRDRKISVDNRCKSQQKQKKTNMCKLPSVHKFKSDSQRLHTSRRQFQQDIAIRRSKSVHDVTKIKTKQKDLSSKYEQYKFKLNQLQLLNEFESKLSVLKKKQHKINLLRGPIKLQDTSQKSDHQQFYLQNGQATEAFSLKDLLLLFICKKIL